MTFLLSVPLFTWLSSGHGQSEALKTEAPKAHVGTIQASWDGSLSGTPAIAHLKGNVKVTSDDYDLSADDIRLYMSPGAKTGASGLREAVAVGGGTPGAQVIAHIRQPLQSASYEVHSDRAVYQPDASRPSGGTLKFTGHVKVITMSGFLAEPSVFTTDTTTILLGVGADYPQVDTGPGHITGTPAQ